jgi:multiple sugar transport system permease protein
MRRWRRYGPAVLLVLPAAVALAVLRVIPALDALWESFYRRSLMDQSMVRFAGFDNYVYLFRQSPTFLNSVRVTLVFVVFTVAMQTLAALLLALLLQSEDRATRLWRTLIFLPITIPTAVSAVVWGTAMRGDGILNGLLARFGIPAQPFLASTAQALPSITLMASWIGVGYWTIFLIAGLKDIPGDVREAAAIDGAGPLRSFFAIILPLMRRPLAFVVVADTIGNFLQFVPAAVLTQGGPQDSTRFIMYEIYNQAFVQGDTSLANTEIVLLLVVLLAIVCVQFRLLRVQE